MATSMIENLTDLVTGSTAGESIVFSLSDLSDFARILSPFLSYAEKAGKRIIHIRFVPDTDVSGNETQDLSARERRPSGLEEIPVRLNHRFRHFTVAVHEAIRAQEAGCIFVFDCLSELQTAWATDLMMVNFFTVTTPLLKSRGDTALFPLMALMHSDEAAGKITQIADCFFDVSSDFKNIYLRA